MLKAIIRSSTITSILSVMHGPDPATGVRSCVLQPGRISVEEPDNLLRH